jgi:sodium transport system ATP-binding protein
MIRATALHKRYGSVIAVDEVTFDALNGQVTGVLGPNGAGKTTSLRLITGLLRPTRGEVRVDDLDPRDDAAAARRRLGVLPDGAGLYGRLTPREHLRYAARLAGLSRAAEAVAVRHAIDAFGLSRLADRATAGFSQGEQRRVALARAIVHDPPNVLLDEPTGALDVLAARVVRKHVRQLAESGRAVIMTTHIMQEAEALCDRIVLIARGRTIATGTPDELRQRGACTSLEAAFVRLVGQEGWE